MKEKEALETTLKVTSIGAKAGCEIASSLGTAALIPTLVGGGLACLGAAIIKGTMK